jgi:hypothetical protein
MIKIDEKLPVRNVITSDYNHSPVINLYAANKKLRGKQWQTTPKNLPRMQPYRSPDWALVPAKTGPRAEY